MDDVTLRPDFLYNFPGEGEGVGSNEGDILSLNTNAGRSRSVIKLSCLGADIVFGHRSFNMLAVGPSIQRDMPGCHRIAGSVVIRYLIGVQDQVLIVDLGVSAQGPYVAVLLLMDGADGGFFAWPLGVRHGRRAGCVGRGNGRQGLLSS